MLGVSTMAISVPSFTPRDVVTLLGEAVKWTAGDLSRPLAAIAPLKDATSSALTFCRYGGDAALAALSSTKAGATIVLDDPGLQGNSPSVAPVLIAVDRPRLAFIHALNRFGSMPSLPTGIARSASIDPSARIHPEARIEEAVIIGPRCIVGARSIIGARTVLHSDVQIGEECVIDPGCVLGVDGFSFERGPDGRQVDFPHFAGVVIGDDVRIGAQCCVDRGTLEDTVIEDGVRIDNHSQISHNCRVETRSVLCGFVVLGGSVTIGHDAWISPHVVIRNQISIGPRAVVGLGAVVMKDVAADDNVLGNPARRVPELKGIRSSVG
jgi:UDP-3-O-[3-hydroxymyristoyl] glucosamine N-acyltransferase